MINSGHLKSSHRVLAIEPGEKIRLNFSQILQQKIRLLWQLKRTNKSGPKTKEEHYEAAFDAFLFKTKIPKQIPVIVRTQYTLIVSKRIRSKIDSLAKIAMKRQQPLAAVIEEALEDYLSLPENYLGTDTETPGKVEKI